MKVFGQYNLILKLQKISIKEKSLNNYPTVVLSSSLTAEVFLLFSISAAGVVISLLTSSVLAIVVNVCWLWWPSPRTVDTSSILSVTFS